ncbi:MAG: type II toxin-antitoxin system VapB family antitoxin [Dehalococcoidia bacterium]
MRTTMDVNPELLKEALEMTGEKSRGKVVDKALEEMIRRRKIEQLIALAGAGKIDFEGDWEKWEEDELREEQERLKRWDKE